MDIGKIKGFKDLKIWKKGIEVVEDIYVLTKNFPKDELYGLTSQMRRAAVSIPSNIAEGFKRFHNKENKQFLYMALGSSAELETQLIISKKLSFINETDTEAVCDKLDHISRMITLLMRKLS
jgi:four helix bundle protein